MRAAQKVRGAKLEGIQFTAPFTYTTQQLWLQMCLVALGIYNIHLASMEIMGLDRFGLAVHQHFILEFMSPVVKSDIAIRERIQHVSVPVFASVRDHIRIAGKSYCLLPLFHLPRADQYPQPKRKL
jgi:hypothetical protein